MEFVSNADYENDSQEVKDNQEKIVTFAGEEKKQREYFAFWKINEKEYQLKLTPPKIMELEKMYKCNLMTLMGDVDSMPTLTTMLQITHAAMVPWCHGIKLKNVEELYNAYIEAGGSMLQFYVDVFIKIYTVSGFFSTGMEEEMTDAMQKMSETM